MPNDPFVDVGDLTSLGKLRYLDVRDQAAFDAGHAHGAMRVRLDEWDAVAKAADTGFATTAYWDVVVEQWRSNRRAASPRYPHRRPRIAVGTGPQRLVQERGFRGQPPRFPGVRHPAAVHCIR
jgi:hypothetical protein